MSDVRGSVWSSWEIDAIVADYFDMLADEVAGRTLNKSEHRRALQALIGRDPGSIERKHQNISAVLERLGVPFIRGYKPLAHFQNSLLDAVERYLTTNGEAIFQFTGAAPERVAEAAAARRGTKPDSESHFWNVGSSCAPFGLFLTSNRSATWPDFQRNSRGCEGD